LPTERASALILFWTIELSMYPCTTVSLIWPVVDLSWGNVIPASAQTVAEVLRNLWDVYRIQSVLPKIFAISFPNPACAFLPTYQISKFLKTIMKLCNLHTCFFVETIFPNLSVFR